MYMLYNNGQHPFLQGKETKSDIYIKLKNPFNYLIKKDWSLVFEKFGLDLILKIMIIDPELR